MESKLVLSRSHVQHVNATLVPFDTITLLFRSCLY